MLVEELWLIISSISEVSFLSDIMFSSGSFPGSGSSPKLGGSTKGDFFSTKNSSLPFFLLPPNPSAIDPQEFKKRIIKKINEKKIKLEESTEINLDEAIEENEKTKKKGFIKRLKDKFNNLDH